MNTVSLLLVDDNAALLNSLSACFAARSDISLIGTASNGVDALEIIERDRPDVVLLDIVMPRLDGLGVLRELARRECHPRVIVFSALKNDAVVNRAVELGASYFIVKPAEPQRVCEQVMSIVSDGAPLNLFERPQADEPSSYARWTPDERVANLFLSIGIPAHVKGYQYLREAVRMVMEDHDVINRITKELYPGIARRYGTSSSKVERAMRHAIEVAWNRGRLENTNQMLGVKLFSERDKPTNGEFIALIAGKASGE
ncbi:MAG: sporulation transcription factor Spo0A [Clostridia bacterium]|nr:sporulation transcription factor Spo0A [Clostridia bacterium]